MCLYLEHFAVAVEVRACPELAGRAVVIGGLPHERKPVFDCSAEAAAFGIGVGLPLREAYHLCPEAAFLPPDYARYTRAFDEILAILDAFSPTVESEGPGMAFVDVSGVAQLFGTEERLASLVRVEIASRTGLCHSIGLGSSKFVAEMAARLCPSGEISLVAIGNEVDFLAPLSTELLPVSNGAKRRLKLLGLRTLDQISSVPADALASQFGQEGFLAHELAIGVDKRPVVSRPIPAELEDEFWAEDPLETVEAVLAALSALLDGLLPRLWSRGQACSKLNVHFDVDGNRTWQESLILKTPTASKQEVMGRVKRWLETQSIPGGILGIRLTLSELCSEPADQRSLEGRQMGRDTAGLARQVRVRLGKSPLKRIVALDPASRIPERRAALVDFPEADD